MDHQFWHDKWSANELGFRQDDFHPFLVRHWPGLCAPRGGRALVPLCGKSRDMLWLEGRGCEVLGAELIDIAARAFFEEQGREARREQAGPFTCCRAGRARVFCGDFFALTPALVPDAAAVFDRAAPPARTQYTDALCGLLRPGVPILLVALFYADGKVAAPPCPVREDEVCALYGAWCGVELLQEATAAAAGQTCAEYAYRLRVKAASAGRR